MQMLWLVPMVVIEIYRSLSDKASNIEKNISKNQPEFALIPNWLLIPLVLVKLGTVFFETAYLIVAIEVNYKLF